MPATVDTLLDLFAALADSTRLRIVGLLLQGEVCVCHIHETLRIPQPKASRHLAYLRRAGLVTWDKRGLWVHYRLTEPRDAQARAMLATARDVIASLPVVQRDAERLKKTRCC